jgi:putative PEP-CTERM system TPR-repeat lipoprotein
VPAWAQADPKAARFYEDALVRYEKKDLPGAIIQLKNALQIDQRMLPVQVLLGKALLETGDVSAAEVAFNEAIKLGVNKAEVVVPLAQALLAQGRQKEVLEGAAFATQGLPQGTQQDLLLQKAIAQADLGNPNLALRVVEEARAINPNTTKAWLAEVPIRIRARQFREGMAAVERALVINPKDPEAQYQKGALLHVQGDMKAALAAYDKVLSLDPKHAESLVARAGLHMDLRQPDKVAADLKTLEVASPREPRAAYLRALLLEQQGKSDEMKAALGEVTAIVDPLPMAYIRYRPQWLMLNGLAHYGLGGNEKAKAYLEAYQLVQPNSPPAKLLARLYLAEKQSAQAVSVLEGYLKARPGDGQAMTLLASAYMAQGQPAKATQLVQEALKTKDDPSFRTALGLGLIGSGQAANGVAELEAAFKKDPKQSAAGVALVQTYLGAGAPNKALPVAQAMVKQQPDNPAFQNLLGMVQSQKGDAQAARTAFERALKLSPNLTQAQLNLARLDLQTGATEAAAQRLTEMLRLDARNTEALAQMALVADRKGDRGEAVRWLEKARDAAPPKDLRWGLALVDVHLRYQQADKALEAAKAASGRAPEDMDTQLAYARAQLANGDAAGAKSTLGRATRYADFNPEKQVVIARLQLQAGNPSGAAYSLDKALSGQPNHLGARILMAETDLRLGDLAKAEQRARELVAQQPKSAVGQLLLGDIAMAGRKPAEAVEAYQKAHQTDPSTATVMKLFGAQMASGADKAALQLADGWLKRQPKDTLVAKAVASAHSRAGQLSEAKKAYEAVLKTSPNDAEALNNLANVQLKLKDPAAVKTAEKALAQAQGNAVVIDTLGWVLFHNGQTDKALQLLRDARLRAPANPEIRYHLAHVLAQTGRGAEAREEVAAALKAPGGFEGRAEAERLQKDLR